MARRMGRLAPCRGRPKRIVAASFLRKYASLSPHMLLYLRMLEYARDNGYQVFH